MATERAGVSGSQHKSRDAGARKRHWRLPNSLEVPSLGKDVHLRWVRKSIGPEQDNSNVVSRKKQYYEPVKPEELGDFEVEVGVEGSNTTGVVVNKDVMLMKVPVEIKEERESYFRDQTRSLTDASNRHWDKDKSTRHVEFSREERDSTKFGDRDRPVHFDNDED